ncbi:MAG: zinc-ribbon domain containing protein [Clostridiales bacterium]|nr:zinc-ribbon domain containing protein [Clostridiales bacterium]
MAYEDKTLVCKDCGKEFLFSAEEQAFYDEKGFLNEPLRCKECRDKKKKSRREYHDVVCASCDAACQVPFAPAGDRPVYCSECFSKIQEERGY